MTDETIRRDLLIRLFDRVNDPAGGVSVRAFRAEHAKHIPEINHLETEGTIIRQDDHYQVSVLELPELAKHSAKAESDLYLCEHVFNKLGDLYKRNPGAAFMFDEIAKYADLPRKGIKETASYFKRVGLFDGYTTDFEKEDATVTPGEKFITEESFSAYIAHLKKSRSSLTLDTEYGFEQELTPIELAESIQNLLHPRVTDHALPHFRNGHLREAVLNSIMAVFELIRERTGLFDLDGEQLIGRVFSIEHPYLIFSELKTDTGRNDQVGFMQILQGAYKGIRNPKAHTLKHDLTPSTVAQYLVFASLLARRVENAKAVQETHKS